MSRVHEFVAEVADADRLANLCGALDGNLRQVEEAFDVRIARRGEKFAVDGPPLAARGAIAALRHFLALAQRPLTLDDIQLGLVELRAAAAPAPGAPAAAHAGDDESPVLHTRRSDLQGRTPRQREYLRNILSHDITFGTGPAGTGKTYLAMAMAVHALLERKVKRIVLTRPKYGGNVGYSVRPSERRKGYAKRMLTECLRVLRAFGLERALVTCLTENEASRKTILACGGVYERTTFCERDGVWLERYWISL